MLAGFLLCMTLAEVIQVMYVLHYTCCCCPVGIFPGSAYHSETGIALSSSDGSLDTDMDDSSDI